MNEENAFAELAGFGSFPSFFTDAFEYDNEASNRVIIPIDENEIIATYYLVYRKCEENEYSALAEDIKGLFHI